MAISSAHIVIEDGPIQRDGSAFRIGDGIYLTAGHNMFFIDYEDDPANRSASDISTGNSGNNDVYYDDEWREYRSHLTSLYLNHVHDSTKSTEQNIAAIFNKAVSDDWVMIERSGDVDSSDPGLVVFLDSSDLYGNDFGLSSTGDDILLSRNGFRSDANDGTIAQSITYTHPVTNVVETQQAAGRAFHDTPSDLATRGDSGTAVHIEFANGSLGMGGRAFVLGTVVSIHPEAIQGGEPYGRPSFHYFSFNDFNTVNQALQDVSDQAGDITAYEPTNLIVGSSAADTVAGSFRADIILGRVGADIITDGDENGDTHWANDQIFGGVGDDVLRAGAGDDLLHGGDFREYNGNARASLESDGQDWVDYRSQVTRSGTDQGLTVRVGVQGTAEEPAWSKSTYGNAQDSSGNPIDKDAAIYVEDQNQTSGESHGKDALVSIEQLWTTDADDTLEISGLSGNYLAGSDLTGGIAIVDLGGNSTSEQGGDEVSFEGLAEDVTVTLGAPTGPTDGYLAHVHATADSDRGLNVRNAERYVGGDGLMTVFSAGNGEYHAGAGGGDFTLWAGDHAVGYDGVKDIFRVSTMFPDEVFENFTDQQKIEYLSKNRVFIENFGAEDEIRVNGELFNGNTVTSQLGPSVASDPNHDLPITAVHLTGDSSYGTSYTFPTFQEEGFNHRGPYGSLVYADGQIRDVRYDVADGSGVGLMTFMARSISAASNGYVLDPLTSSDEMLILVVDGFSNGDGGITFENDLLANLARPGFVDPRSDGIFHRYTYPTGWGEDWVQIPHEWDIDGVFDGYMFAGGEVISSTDPRYNYGYRPFEGLGIDWERFIAGPQQLVGTGDADDLTGADFDDTISSGDGNDVLVGGAGDDMLSGEAGNDQIYGNAGNDILLGGLDADRLAGGAGADQIDGGDGYDIAEFDGSVADYAIYRDEAGALIVERASDDPLNPWSTDSDADVLTNVEELRFTDAQVDPSTVPAGSSGADVFSGGAGYDVFYGVGGNDSIDGGDGANRLFGNGGDDTLVAGAGNDLLDGGTGDDSMTGGGGDDSYVVDSLGDTVVEDLGEGVDAVTTTLTTYSLGSNVEYLAYLGSSNFTGIGNELDNVLLGGSGDDTLSGGDGDDTFLVSGGNDSLDGGLGWDVVALTGKVTSYVYGTDGLGGYTISDGSSTLQLINVEGVEFGEDGFHYLDQLLSISMTGTAGADSIDGDAEDNRISGLAGDDVLWGKEGNDRLDGGDGLDVAYYAESSSDYLIFRDPSGGVAVGDIGTSSGGDGWDRILNIESFFFAGDQVSVDISDVPAIGTAGNDTIAGSARVDWLYGLDGDDTVSSGEGDDKIYAGTGHDDLAGDGGQDYFEGGAGNDVYHLGAGEDRAFDVQGDDTYHYDLGDGDDSIEDYGGANVLHFGAGITSNDISIALDDNDFILQVANGGNVTLKDRGLEIGSFAIAFDSEPGWDLMEHLRTGTSGNDTLFGGTGGDTISGGAGDDVIDGRSGNDTLSGDPGTDTLHGGSGDDIYRFAPGDGQDSIDDDGPNSASGWGGNDAIVFDPLISPSQVTVSQSNTGRNLVLSISGTPDQITIVDGAYTSRSAIEEVRFADDTVWTLADLMDEVLVPTSGSDTLYGSFAAETILGADGNDHLWGRGGNDTLDGGNGTDNLRGEDGDDTLIGGAGNDTLTGGNGSDTVDYGTATAAWIINLGATSAQGKSGTETDTIASVENVIGGSGADTITGNSSANTLIGGGGNDTLSGGSGADVLDGGTGDDTMSGGSSDDRFIVDNTGDVVLESSGQGTDSVDVYWLNYTLPTNVENLRLFGSGNFAGTGNILSNTIEGNLGDDQLSGLDGDDYLEGGGGNDILTGGAGTDTAVFRGNSADYLLTLEADGTVTVEDSSVAEGIDTLVAVEHIFFWGDEVTINVADLGPSYNYIVGTSAGDTLEGTTGRDHITGLGGQDYLSGYEGDDVLIGDEGGDEISGGAGTDSMSGGEGDDFYDVDDVGDVVAENADEGFDFIQASVNYTLSAHAESLLLWGEAATHGTGNELDNYLTGSEFENTLLGLGGNDVLDGDYGDDVLDGGDGDDYLAGQEGDDLLTGGGGSDVFSFGTWEPPLGSDIDTVADFVSGVDAIELASWHFTGLSAGALAAGAFVIGSAAGDTDDRIIYNSATGALYFDADGSGATAAIEFANLASSPSLSASDILVI